MTAEQQWNLSDPHHFTVGASGEPGQRVFYLQAIDPEHRVEVKCEKQQAVALAEHLVRLIADLPEPAGGRAGEPVAPTRAFDPVHLSFVLGSISIGVDRARERIVAMLEELVVEPEDDAPVDGAPIDDTPAKLLVHLTRDQVLGFAAQARALASSGRPLCRLCDQPVDPAGHACPRLN